MISKQRVYAAISHKPCDKPPRFIWFSTPTKTMIKEQLGLSENKFLHDFGNDILSTWVSINGEMERDIEPGKTHTDDWGITWKKEGYYNMVIDHPLKGKSLEQIKNYILPDPFSESRYSELERLIQNYGDEYFIGADVSGTIFEPAYHLRHMEELMMDLVQNKNEANVLLDKITDFSVKVAIESIKRGVDWVWLGDDMGAQYGMMISPDMWRKYFKPRMKNAIDLIRDYKKDTIIAYHSCGSMYPIVGDLVELGIDVLNPIQESASNMDQKEFKAEFGDEITLMCGPDTQMFLATASEQEVYDKTCEKIVQLGKNGGYIFAVSHTLQPDVPLENICAMIKALND